MGFWNTKKGSQTPEAFGDEHLAKKPQTIGQDSYNEVYKTTYKDKHAMGDQETGFFKPDGAMSPAYKAVGASRLAKGMGWGNLIPETHYATHDVTNMHGEERRGVEGAVSKAAKGDALMSPVWDTHLPNHTGGASEQVRIKGGQAYGNSGTEMNSGLDLSKGNTQKQLNQLQWFDALIGNEDRHGGNILIDPDSGNVTGIDNDLAFGMIRAKMGGQDDPLFDTGWDEKFLGMPEQIDEETANTLLGLDPDSLEAMLAPEDGAGKGMSKKQIADTRERLQAIQTKVGGYKNSGKLVDTWDANTYDAAKNMSKHKGAQSGGALVARNYIQRHEEQLHAAVDPSKPTTWRKGHRTEDTTAPKWSAPDTSSKGSPTPKMSLGGSRATPSPSPSLSSKSSAPPTSSTVNRSPTLALGAARATPSPSPSLSSKPSAPPTSSTVNRSPTLALGAARANRPPLTPPAPSPSWSKARTDPSPSSPGGLAMGANRSSAPKRPSYPAPSIPGGVSGGETKRGTTERTKPGLERLKE